MVTDRELRRLGICGRNPAARRLLALTLGDCGIDAVEWLLVRATREVGPHDAANVATQQLQDGSWREAWAAERRRRATEEVGGMPRERMEGLVACRVLADRRTVDEVAAEFHLERDEVRRLVIRHGVRRGMTDDLIGQALGLVPARRVELPVRPHVATTPVPPPVASEPAPTPTRAQLVEMYHQAGRRPPAHVLEILTATRKS